MDLVQSRVEAQYKKRSFIPLLNNGDMYKYKAHHLTSSPSVSVM